MLGHIYIASIQGYNTLDATRFFFNPRLQSQIVSVCITPQAKLFSLQSNNQSKMSISAIRAEFSAMSGPGEVHRIATGTMPSLFHYVYTLRSASEIVSKLLPYFLDYSAPLFSSRPRIDRTLCPGLRVILRALE